MENVKGKKEKLPHPRAKAFFLSSLTFSWLYGTFWKGFKRDLEAEDLYEPLNEHKSEKLGDQFEREWENEVKRAKEKNKKPKFLNVIVRVFFWRQMMYGVIIAISELVIKLLQPFFIGLLVRYFNTPEDSGLEEPGEDDPQYFNRFPELFGTPQSRITKGEAIFNSFGIILTSTVLLFFTHPYMMALQHQGMQMRVGSCSLIYRKALKLSKTALGKTTVGQVVNLLSNDVNRFDIAIMFLHFLYLGPLQTIICTYFMYRVVNWAVFPGVGFMLLLVPFQMVLGSRMSVIRLRTALRTDERVRLMNEIISGIQVIKMYTWEKTFANLVALARKKEINQISISANFKGVLFSFVIFSTRFAVFLSIIAHVLRMRNDANYNGPLLTAEVLFILTSFYSILRQSMTIFFPSGVFQVAEMLISIRRLETFLLYEENHHPRAILGNKVLTPEQVTGGGKNTGTEVVGVSDTGKSPTPGIRFNEAVAYWVKAEQHDPTLNHITLNIVPGKLLAVIGPVGSGKSSLLQAALKELPLTSGSLTVTGSVSYASQEPWLFAGSIRQNILFGAEYDRHRYQQVVTVCALKRDFELFEYGDRTIVGERGISLSGGQRARINLARAVYKEADIYLLDDPLSAVDTHVGAHLFDDCVYGYLRKKTVILVTHQLQYLKEVDHIIIMNNGSVEVEGSFNELQKSGMDFAQLLHEEGIREGEAQQLQQQQSIVSSSRRGSSISSTGSQISGLEKEPEEVAEQRTKGNVGLTVYKSYFKAYGRTFLIFAMFVMFVVSQAVGSVADYWGSKWSGDEEMNNRSTSLTEDEKQESTDINMYVYLSVNVATVVFTLVRSWLFFYCCMRASRNLHNAMFSKITRAPMRFFHTNPSGRILNRFSKDMGAIDELMPQAMMDTFQIFLTLLGIVILIAIVSPILLVPTAVIAVIFYFLRTFYLKTSRSVKRLEGITRSPVFQHLSATLQGLTTIRAFNAEGILRREFDNHQDLHSSSWYIFLATSRAFGLWLDSFCCLFIAVVIFVFLFWQSDSGSEAGLAITQSLALTGMFQWGMRQSAELENQMTSVERVLEYTNVDQEPALESKPDKKPPATWPPNGVVEFKHTNLKYDPDGQDVLRDVNFIIREQEKVGIVGRTGAGKSTLISALFRLAYIDGKIEIDSVETSEIGLHDLRSKISIIPQEPVLFSGTMRKNLDPFDEYPDWVLWQALEEVELKEVVNEMPNGLSSKMSEGGGNFSVGQRQLVCLARAIIRNNRILIMDEATANVDPQTDLLIQRTIRKKFNNCTVLTIAHRLNTVMDSDRILVMDAGKLVEFDHPYVLLRNERSVLFGMVKQTGPSTAQKLMKIAKKNYKIMIKKEESKAFFEETMSIGSSSSDSLASPSLNKKTIMIKEESEDKEDKEDKEKEEEKLDGGGDSNGKVK